MPNLRRPKRPAYRAKRQRGNQGANQSFYQSRRWRAIAKSVRRQATINNQGIGCEICNASDGTGSADHCDHILPISDGGAPLDKRNLWGICAHHHNVKSGYERHGLRVGTINGGSGLFPSDRQQVIDLVLHGRRASSDGDGGHTSL